MLCHFWYFKDVKFKFKSNIYRECSIICVFSKKKKKKKIEILNVKGVYYRCVLCGIGRKKAVNILNNLVLEDKGVIILNNSDLIDKMIVLYVFNQI